MSDINHALRKKPAAPISPTKDAFQSNLRNYFDHYITNQNTSNAHLISVPEHVRIYFILYVKQLQSIDGMFDETRQQLELFVNANMLQKFNTVIETIRKYLDTFTEELINQIGGGKDASVVPCSSANLTANRKKVKLNPKGSDETTVMIEKNNVNDNDDFELQMGKATEECERQYLNTNPDFNNAGQSSINHDANQIEVVDGKNTLFSDQVMLMHFLDNGAPAQSSHTYTNQFPNSSLENIVMSRDFDETIDAVVSNIVSKPKRKKKEKKLPQNRDQRRKNKYSNQLYYTAEGREVRPKEFEDFHCSCECYKKVTVEQRRQLFDKYWALGDYMKQTVFIGTQVRQKPVARRRPRIQGIVNIQRQCSRDYTLLNQKVCQSLFVRTLGITRKRVHTALEKMYQTFDLQDRRGGHRERKNPTNPTDATNPRSRTKKKSTKSKK